MTIIDTREFDFAYKAMQYPLPPTWKYAVRQQDQIMWLLQALLAVNAEYEKYDEAIARLEQLIEDTKSGFNSELEQAKQLTADLRELKNHLDDGSYMHQWFIENKQPLEIWFKEIIETDVAENIAKFATLVHFGLDDDGYFVAYIPESWDMIEFSTGTDYDNPNEYGHLILKY